MRAVLLRLGGEISDAEFRTRISDVVPDACLREHLERLVYDRCLTSVSTAIPKVVDLFVRDALQAVAIGASSRRLRRLSGSAKSHVAWGNTNTQARDYAVALRCAEESNRPVKFVRWGHELPELSTEELVRRNVERFVATGRYIPVGTIDHFRRRTETLLQKSRNGDPVLLANLSGYRLDGSGHVQRRPGAL